jgi:hypothetical protein
VEAGAAGLAGYLLGLSTLALFAIAAGLGVTEIGRALGEPVIDPLDLANWPTGGTLVGVLATAGLGVLLWRFESPLRARMGPAAGLLFALLRLDWLYRAAWAAISLIDRAMYNLAGVLEGEGALLWALAMALAVVLLFR